MAQRTVDGEDSRPYAVAARSAIRLEVAIRLIEDAARECPDMDHDANSPDVVAIRGLYAWHDRLMDVVLGEEEKCGAFSADKPG